MIYCRAVEHRYRLKLELELQLLGGWVHGLALGLLLRPELALHPGSAQPGIYSRLVLINAILSSSIEVSLKITSASTGQTDRPSEQLTDRTGHREVSLPIKR